MTNVRRTKIVCTIGPASDDQVDKLLAAGMDVARLNFSHGTLEEQEARIHRLRAAAADSGRILAILQDIQGPKIRVGQMAPDSVLQVGEPFVLVTEEIVGDGSRATVGYPHLHKLVRAGDMIYLDDGLLQLKVESVENGEIHTTVHIGGVLTSRKGVSVPGVSVDLPAITETDIEHIRFGVELGVDMIAASFVRKAEHIEAVRQVIREAGGSQPIIAKIENHEGLDHLEAIVEAADGVMVARGDLGVQIPPEEVPIVQKRIIEVCNAAGKPVITATQMLESMVANPRPTRAEVTDVATAIFDGTDAIMLSGETAMGRHPVESVRMMDRIARRTERAISYEQLLRGRRSGPSPAVGEAISYATCRAASDLDAAAIMTATQSGATARMVSKFRPTAPIVALTPVPQTARELMLSWGVEPVVVPHSSNIDEMIDVAADVARRRLGLNPGTRVVITAGVKTGEPGSTNLLQVYEVEGVDG